MSESNNAVWNGHITFGLISVPVRLYTAARSERVSLNQLHSLCRTRIRQPLWCPTCARQVERTEVVKGYEFEKEKFVLFTQEEIRNVEPPSSSVIEITEFINMAEVDPIYFDASYFVAPQDGGHKAYKVLRVGMQVAGLVALGRITMHQRENVTVIRPHMNGGLTLQTLYYEHEIRDLPQSFWLDEEKLHPKDIDLARQLIESLQGHFTPQNYRDDFRDTLVRMIEQRREGNDVGIKPKQMRLAPVIDLADALRRSIENKRRA